MATLFSRLQPLRMLTRPLLSAGVAAVTAAVYIYYRHIADAGMFFVATGVFMLTCAASILNQYQERDTDARMERTKRRPFAAGIPGTGRMLLFAAGIGAAGLTVLFRGAGAAAALLGGASVIIYNGIYTPAKRHTHVALFAGAVAGALPVLIGCVAATGRIEATAVFIAGFAFIWQIPHFMLLSCKFTDDYARAGLPTLPALVAAPRLKVITVLWMLAACGAAVLFPVARIITNIPLVAVLMLSTILMLLWIVGRFVRRNDTIPGWGFHAYQGVIVALLAMQGILGR